MKFKSITYTVGKFFCGACLMLVAGLVASCSDDDKIDVNTPYDPSQPVVITGFTPESGGYQEQIIVKGQNFGNDKSIVGLTIGGKKAVIVSVLADKLYAYIPASAFSKEEETPDGKLCTGEIELTITDKDGNARTAKAQKLFKYTPKKVVGTLCGYQNENDSQGEVWGSFDIAAGFSAEGCMALDPLFPDRLYIAYDRGDGFIAMLDLENRVVSRMMSATKFQSKRLRNIAFSLDGQYMLVSTDRNDQGLKSPSVWIVSRRGDGSFDEGSQCQPLVSYKQCNGVAVHPKNGEVYFNSYENGQLFRMELEDYFAATSGETVEGEDPKVWTGYLEDGAFRELFKIMDPSYEFQITIHPTGDYAYLTVINRHYILRTDYDWNKKEFTTPYIVAGSNGQTGWEDAVGGNARVDRPYQGVFVKNPKYVEEGRSDEYDYYFCDNKNFCVRYLTPDGLVRTYAGRAPSTNGNIWGTEDGDLRQQARFRDVSGIAYDVKRDRFYVLDNNNRRVRTIGMESSDMITVNPTPDEGDSPSEDNGGEENQE